MVKTKRLIVDARTGEKKVEEFEFVPIPQEPKIEISMIASEKAEINLIEVAELLKYAKEKGWIVKKGG